VPKIINGRRVITHSVGIVTNPEVLKTPGHDYTDQETFLRAVREIPFLRDMLQDARPIADGMLTATNYSRVSERFADIDERYLLVGDAAFFVDPLFSSGVAVATTQALSAALVLQATVDPAVPETHKRDIWHDYNTKWHAQAETFALVIDQWYHAIAKNNPGSTYWNARGSGIELDLHKETFAALLNTSFQPTVLQILTHGSRRITDLDRTGPFLAASALADPAQLTEDAVLSLAPGVVIRESATLRVPGFKAAHPPAPITLPPPVKAGIATYWHNPIENAAAAPAPLHALVPCHRIVVADGSSDAQVEGDARMDGILELWDLLAAGPVRYGDIVDRLSRPQQVLVKRLCVSGLLEITPAERRVTLASSAGD
jgi:Tryptophan halogenase